MNRSRRVRSPPPYGYDPRTPGRPGEPGARPLDYKDDPYHPHHHPHHHHVPVPPPFESAPPTYMEQPHPQQQQYPTSYRDHRLPSTYRATMREPSYSTVVNSPATYKILCITNINHKISDGPVKEALLNDFSRFGDISVSICHDSGERLAYIYFRTYEEAREARHAKARSLFFDRPIEIEPIYERRSPPMDSPPQQAIPTAAVPTIYPRRRSMTPPDYYGVNGPSPPHQTRRLPPPPPQPMGPHRGISPPNFSHSSRYPPGPGPSPPLPPAPIPHDRYYMPPSHLSQPSPYSSPPHAQYKSYHPHSSQYSPGHSYRPSYVPPSMIRERDRPINDSHLANSPRNEAYYPMEHRGYPPPPPQHISSRAAMHLSSSRHLHQSSSPNIHNQPPNRRSPLPHMDHPRYSSRDYRREKFSSDIHNNEPDEGKPSRVIFVSNIDSSKTPDEVREFFAPFGVIEEFEVKKITKDLSSALVRYTSMDCAYKAKTALNGKHMGNSRCRIYYGKVSASRRLWIGGLGPMTSLACLEDEFGKFGDIINMDYISGRPYAYVEYESASEAQFATLHLRGTLVAGAERRIRIEFVDPVVKPAKGDTSVKTSDANSKSRQMNESDKDSHSSNHKRSLTPTETNTKRFLQDPDEPSDVDKTTDELSPGTKSAKCPPGSPTATQIDNFNYENDELNNNQDHATQATSNFRQAIQDEMRIERADPNSIDKMVLSKSIRDVVDSCSISWFGQLVLRNFNFPSKMFMCSGQKATIERYITKLNGENGNECPILRITQRWRLHPQPKLEEVKRRMQSGNLGMLIITPRSDQSPTLSSPSCKTPQSSTSQPAAKQLNGESEKPSDEKTMSSESPITQSRPLKNLISYLEQKDAAGVISLNALDRDQSDGPKLLYTFPPGDFALNLLKRRAPNLTLDTTREEYLLGVIVGGVETKA